VGSVFGFLQDPTVQWLENHDQYDCDKDRDKKADHHFVKKDTDQSKDGQQDGKRDVASHENRV
jgi:hypothetical protein